MTALAYQLTAISPDAADALRRAGGVIVVAATSPGYPCRQCLHDAEVGEELLLVSYDPFEAASPYRSSSPIFLHRHACTPYSGDDVEPVQLTSRQLSIRGFDAEEMMIDAAVVEGIELAPVLTRMFNDPATAFVHVHNAVRGCWAARADRPVSSSNG